MRPRAELENDWSQVSDLVARTMGLHFPRERWSDLQRGLTEAAAEFGFSDVAECAGQLLATTPTPEQLQVLAGHLTIGETYFFREKKTLDVLTTRVLPALIDARRGREQRLRLWSAGCCTGEEAYTLAMLLRQLLPDLADWRVTILATDINPLFLRKAVAGSYGEWSFRDAPAELRERYFTRGRDGRHTVVPEIRNMVTFAHLNLVDDAYPSLATDTNAMDVILCRNVLMYFTPEQAGRVIEKFHHALLAGGTLAVSPSEASRESYPQFVPQNHAGAILFQKSPTATWQSEAPLPAVPPEPVNWFRPVCEPVWFASKAEPEPAPPEPPSRPVAAARPTPEVWATELYAEGRYADAVSVLLDPSAGIVHEPRSFSLLARAFANQGRLSEALAWCERWLAADKLDAAGHYLRAIILLEQGREPEARQSLQRSVYLDPAFVPAHFTLGNLARGAGRIDEANRHFANALQLLSRLRTEDVLPESDGLTAGRLTETIKTLTQAEKPR